MARLLRAFFYKLAKDITFRITLIIGGGLAVLMTLLFFLIDSFAGEGMKTLCGPSMLVFSFSPYQNFGISLPINIVSFIILEFTQGTIRNKIIAGHSKFKIYTSLFISGLVLALALIIVYAGACTLFGTIFGGFNLDDIVMLGTSGAIGKVTVEFIVKFIILGLLSYITIASFAVLVASAFRSMGPSIPLVLVGIMALSMLAMLMGVAVLTTEAMIGGTQSEIADYIKEAAKLTEEGTDPDRLNLINTQLLPGLNKTLADQQSTLGTLNNVCNVLKCVDPLYGVSSITTKDGVAVIDDLTFYGGIGGNLAFTAAFFFGGACLFKKRDIK